MYYSLWIERRDGGKIHLGWDEANRGKLLDFLALHDVPQSKLRLEVYHDEYDETPTHTYWHPDTVYHVLSDGHLRREEYQWFPEAQQPSWITRFMLYCGRRTS